VKLRKGPNATLIAPRRGKPPAVPDGYKATKNEYVFEPILPPCKYRTRKQCDSCDGLTYKDHCDLFNKYIVAPICLKCEDAEE